ncbi:MAG: ATP-binding protein [Bacteroidetes bacterium]|nr:ATP-binding protein [Bacteroidota bacterium]
MNFVIAMLIRFKVKNYLSFKDEVELDLTAEALKEKKDYTHCAYLYNPKLNLVKSAAVFGHNAYGKSNIIKAYSFFRKFILTSFTFGKITQEIDVEPFLLNTSTTDSPSFFEATFIVHNTKYRYAFEVNNERIISEELHYADGAVRENLLFIRAHQEIREISKLWNKQAENRIEQAKLFSKPQSLFLSVLLAQDSIPRINKIAEWFRGNIILNENYGLTTSNAANIYSKEEYRTAILRFLDNSDLGFTSIFSKVANYISSGKLTKETADFLFGIEMSNFDLFTQHNVYDAEYSFIRQVEFNLLKNESSGTIKYFILACHLAYAIKNSQLILIDELDASLSTQLLVFLLETYHNNKNNVTGSQMIFVVHNTVLLNKKLRRDQIWFIDKNKYGESTIHKGHTVENPIRIDKSIEQDFRDGKTKGTSKKATQDNVPTLFDNLGDEK